MAKRNTLFHRIQDRPYGETHPFNFYDSTKNSKSLLQRLRLQVKIPAHNGCVNSICWNENGRYLLSGSDDRHLCVSNPYKHTVESYIPTGHRSNIFSVKFLPGSDNKVVSCAGDGTIIYSDLENPDTSLDNKFMCHFGTTYEIMTIQNEPHSFLSCGEDCTVRWFDLRTKTSCSNSSCKEDILLKFPSAVSALAVHPYYPYQLGVGCADSSVRIYDRRMLATLASSGSANCKVDIQALISNFSVPEFSRNHRITSLCYSRTGEEMLVSYSSEFLYLFDVRCSYSKDPKILSCFSPDSIRSTAKPPVGRPFMKRLRVRGDWSDTGPNARPESEIGVDQNSRSIHTNLMQRMSDALTNMYSRQSRLRQAAESPSTSEGSNDNAGTEGEGDNDRPDEEQEGGNNRQPDFSPDASNNSVPEAVPNANDIIETNGTIDEENSDNDGNSVPTSPTCDPNVSYSPGRLSKSMESDNESCSDHPADNNYGVLNVSLENIKQEMSKTSSKEMSTSFKEISTSFKEISTASVKIPQESVINGKSSTCDQSSFSVSDENTDDIKMDSVSSDHEAPVSEVHHDDDMIHESEGDESHCDMDDTLSPLQSDNQGDGSSPHRPENRHRTVSASSATSTSSQASSSSRMSEGPIPDIFIATDQADEGETSVMTDVPNENQRQMTLIMEMDGWEEEAARVAVPSTSASRLETMGIHVSETIPSDENDEEDLAEMQREEEDHLRNIPHPRVMNKYMGHRNARTMIKEATFWGDDFVMSGSDCGHIFVWNRHTAELVMIMEADHHVVNCLQPHPFDPILASSGIDYDIKLWAPLHEDSLFDEEKAQEIIMRNGVMLEETKDTVTVPASFMIRMLASLNHITAATGSRWRNMARRLREGRQNQ